MLLGGPGGSRSAGGSPKGMDREREGPREAVEQERAEPGLDRGLRGKAMHGRAASQAGFRRERCGGLQLPSSA